MSSGMVIVISAPSGGGKSTLIAELLRKMKRLTYSVSVTTRAPRAGEKEGREYFFITERKFLGLRKKRRLVEHAFVHGHWYGTPRGFVDRHLKEGTDVILDIDVQGGRQVKRIYPGAVLVFIAPPSLEVLQARLRRRGQDDEATIRRRLKAVRREAAWAKAFYDYVVLNDTIPQAYNQLESIVVAERSRMRTSRGLLERLARREK